MVSKISSLTDFVNRLQCPEILYDAISYHPCCHKRNQNEGIKNSNGKCGEDDCKTQIKGWHYDPVIREISRKIFSVITMNIEELIPLFQCPVDGKKLTDAVTLVPCGHKVNNESVGLLFNGKKGACTVCKSEVYCFNEDKFFSALTEFFFEHVEQIKSIQREPGVELKVRGNVLVYSRSKLKDHFFNKDEFVITTNKQFILAGLSRSVCESFNELKGIKLHRNFIELLNDILLPISKSVCSLSLGNNTEFGFVKDKGVICITPREFDVAIRVSSDKLSVNIESLFKRLLEENSLEFFIKTNQELYIKDIDEKTLRDVIREPINLGNFLATKCPKDYQGDIEFFGETFKMFREENPRALVISSKYGFKFNLEKKIV